MNNDALLFCLQECKLGNTVSFDRLDLLDIFLDYKNVPKLIRDISELNDHSPVVTEQRALQEFEKWIKQFELEYYFDIRTDSYIIRAKK